VDVRADRLRRSKFHPPLLTCPAAVTVPEQRTSR
jgi:hypothetical protein